MSDETFSELKESFEQALQHARGERDDLRVTVAPAPQRMKSEPSETVMSVKEMVLQKLDDLNEDGLRKVAEFVTSLSAQEEFGIPSAEPARDSDIHMTDEEKEQYLEELLAGITEENLHPEIQTGPPVGNEVW